MIQRHVSELMYFFFNDTATTEIYTLSLHDALPIYGGIVINLATGDAVDTYGNEESVLNMERVRGSRHGDEITGDRSEEHTSELQSRQYLVCRLLLEKKK